MPSQRDYGRKDAYLHGYESDGPDASEPPREQHRSHYHFGYGDKARECRKAMRCERFLQPDWANDRREASHNLR